MKDKYRDLRVIPKFWLFQEICKEVHSLKTYRVAQEWNKILNVWLKKHLEYENAQIYN